MPEDTRTEVEKACAFFNCGAAGKDEQMMQYYTGVLLCALFGKDIEVVVTDPSVTPNIQLIPASTTVSIPIGAKGWTVTFLTGTGTVDGAAVLAGFSDSDNKVLLAAISVHTDAASSAYLRYNT